MRASVVLGPARYSFRGAGIFKSALTEMICYISRIAAFHFSRRAALDRAYCDA